MARGFLSTSRPAINTLPEVGGRYEVRMRIRVVFPAPFFPKKPDDLSLTDLERNTFKRFDFSKIFRNILSDDHLTKIRSTKQILKKVKKITKG